MYLQQRRSKYWEENKLDCGAPLKAIEENWRMATEMVSNAHTSLNYTPKCCFVLVKEHLSVYTEVIAI